MRLDLGFVNFHYKVVAGLLVLSASHKVLKDRSPDMAKALENALLQGHQIPFDAHVMDTPRIQFSADDRMFVEITLSCELDLEDAQSRLEKHRFTKLH
jgi:hypothetical protein